MDNDIRFVLKAFAARLQYSAAEADGRDDRLLRDTLTSIADATEHALKMSTAMRLVVDFSREQWNSATQSYGTFTDVKEVFVCEEITGERWSVYLKSEHIGDIFLKRGTKQTFDFYNRSWSNGLQEGDLLKKFKASLRETRA